MIRSAVAVQLPLTATSARAALRPGPEDDAFGASLLASLYPCLEPKLEVRIASSGPIEDSLRVDLDGRYAAVISVGVGDRGVAECQASIVEHEVVEAVA